MLIRQNYYVEKREKILDLVLDVLDNLTNMIDRLTKNLQHYSKDHIEFILDSEKDINEKESKIEEHIMEAVSLQQLNVEEIKWMFGMNRINRELERIGDQITNIITISNYDDIEDIQPIINTFLQYEQKMIHWLIDGIQKNDSDLLQKVIEHDEHINKLNKGTYKNLVESINEKDTITESSIKIVIISRFLERMGDHLVNIARTYLKLI